MDEPLPDRAGVGNARSPAPARCTRTDNCTTHCERSTGSASAIPLRADADRLRADIQRDLFAVAGVPVAVTPREAAVREVSEVQLSWL